MTDTGTLPPITLPAELVVPAWRNAFLATGDDPDRPALHRTVLVEWFPDGLRFVSTDSYMLVASYAAGSRYELAHEAPDHGEAPLGTVVAIAADEKDPGPGPIDVTFSLGTIDDPDMPQQQLDLGEPPQRALIVSCDNERIALPLFDGGWVSWRAILAGYKPAPRAKVAAKRGILHRIGQLDSHPSEGSEDWLLLSMANAGALVMVHGAGRVPLEGAFVPRHEESDEIEEAA